jgi:predicted nucleic acid-binding protein
MTRAIAILNSLPVFQHDLSIDTVLERIRDLASSQSLTVYDAAYLDIAMMEGLQLATQDNALRAAAARVNVSVLGLG